MQYWHVLYLGHVFSSNGDWPIPQDVHAVRQFLGFVSYYRRYIRQFADIAAPLHRLTQKGIAFQWSNKCKEALENLKRCLSNAPVLVL